MSAPAARRRALVFVLVFGVAAGLGTALIHLPGWPADFTLALDKALVTGSAGLIKLVDREVFTDGIFIVFKKGANGVNVAPGCEALQVCVLLAAAIIAYGRSSWLMRAVGVVVCLGGIQLINLLRIVSLVLLARFAPKAFNFFHLYLWDAVIMLSCILLFLAWVGVEARVRRAFKAAARA